MSGRITATGIICGNVLYTKLEHGGRKGGDGIGGQARDQEEGEEKDKGGEKANFEKAGPPGQGRP